jgi:periplasmic protein TonB
MHRRIIDWKDIAGSYYEKSLSLAILLLLFSFLVSPKMEVKPYHRDIVVTQAIDIPPEVRDRIQPPQEMVRPQVQIMVESDDIAGDDDIEIVDTIAATKLDPWETKEPPPQFGQTSKFVIFEDAPVPIRRVPPVYPSWGKQAGIEGSVTLQVEVLKDGKVGAIEVLKSLSAGPGGFDEAAVKAVKQWEFQPAKTGGQPIACWVTFPIQFNLD